MVVLQLGLTDADRPVRADRTQTSVVSVSDPGGLAAQQTAP
jgi:hypothetical protein